MIEIRWARCGDGLQLQQRTRLPCADINGAFCGFAEWSPWVAVPIVHGDGAERPVVDIFDTRNRHDNP